MTKLIDKLNKYKESCLDDCGYVIHGEAESLVFESAKLIERYEKGLKEIAEMEKGLYFYKDRFEQMKDIAKNTLHMTHGL